MFQKMDFALWQKGEPMTWDEFLNKNIEYQHNGQVRTDIVCPECGRKIYFDSTIILTTYPAKFHYWCSCGWTGTAHERWCGNTERRTDE